MTALTTAASEWVAPAADAALKGTLLLLAAGIAALALRRASAALRHLVWCLALLGLALLPALSLALPAWRVLPAWFDAAAAADRARLLPHTPLDAVPALARSNTGEPVPAPGPSLPETTAEARPPLSDAQTPETLSPLTPPETAATVTPAAPPAPSKSPASAEPLGAAMPSWPAWLLAAWAVGAAAAFAPLPVAWARLRRLARACGAVTAGPWVAALDRAARQLGVTPPVRLLRGGERAMPMAWGTFRPVVLLPADAACWPAGRLRVVLLHELAHVQRRDCLTHLLARAVCSLYWFHPLAWYALHRLRVERERACDDLVLSAGVSGASRDAGPGAAAASDACDAPLAPEYAEHLLKIATGLEALPLAATAAQPMARRSTLEGRLLAILDEGRNRRAVTRAAALAAAVSLAAALVPVAMVRAQATNPGIGDKPAAEAALERAAHEDMFALHGGVLELWRAWVKSRPGPGGPETPAEPIFLVIDAGREEIYLDRAGTVRDAERVRFPRGYRWTLYHVTPRGAPVLSGPGKHAPVRLLNRGDRFLDGLRPEIFRLQGLIGEREAGIVLDLMPGGLEAFNGRIKDPAEHHFKAIGAPPNAAPQKSVLATEDDYRRLATPAAPPRGPATQGAADFSPSARWDAAARDFLNAMAVGRDDEAFAMMAVGTRRERFKPATVRELYDLSKAAIVMSGREQEHAFVVTSFFPSRDGQRRMAMGVGLVLQGERWAVRDIDALPDQAAIDAYVESFHRGRAAPPATTAPATRPAEAWPPKGLEFLAQVLELQGLTLETREADFVALLEARKLKAEKSQTQDGASYHVSTPAGENIVVMFRPDGTCRGIQRLRPSPPAWSEPVNGVSVRAWPERDRVEIGEDAVLRFEFKNVGEREIRMYKDLALGRNVHARWTTADGRTDTFLTEPLSQVAAREEETVLLKPGEVHAASWPLNGNVTKSFPPGAASLVWTCSTPKNSNPQVEPFWGGVVRGQIDFVMTPRTPLTMERRIQQSEQDLAVLWGMLQQHRQRHGAWPRMLSDLVQGAEGRELLTCRVTRTTYGYRREPPAGEPMVQSQAWRRGGRVERLELDADGRVRVAVLPDKFAAEAVDLGMDAASGP